MSDVPHHIQRRVVIFSRLLDKCEKLAERLETDAANLKNDEWLKFYQYVQRLRKEYKDLDEKNLPFIQDLWPKLLPRVQRMLEISVVCLKEFYPSLGLFGAHQFEPLLDAELYSPLVLSRKTRSPTNEECGTRTLSEESDESDSTEDTQSRSSQEEEDCVDDIPAGVRHRIPITPSVEDGRAALFGKRGAVNTPEEDCAIFDEQERQKDSIETDLLNMVKELKEGSMNIRTSLKQDLEQLEEVEGRAGKNLANIERQRSRLNIILDDSVKMLCSTIGLIMLVLALFVATYFFMRIVPK